MPTRKQRRRREKTFRHEYGFVTVDDEGNEVELEGAALRAKKEAPAAAKSTRKPAAKEKRARRTLRDPDPPSWQRSLRRGALWSPATVVLSIIVFHSASLPLRIVIGLAYAGMFIPMTYWMDGVVYRRHERRKLAAEPRAERASRTRARRAGGHLEGGN